VVPRAVLDRLADLVDRRARVLADPLSLFGALGAVDGQMEDALWSARFLGNPMCLVAEAALADPQGENEDAAAAPMPPSPACPRPPERPTA
jgi:hypothetical protein